MVAGYITLIHHGSRDTHTHSMHTLVARKTQTHLIHAFLSVLHQSYVDNIACRGTHHHRYNAHISDSSTQHQGLYSSTQHTGTLLLHTTYRDSTPPHDIQGLYSTTQHTGTLLLHTAYRDSVPSHNQHCIPTECRVAVPGGEHVSHMAAHSLRVTCEVQ